VTVRYTGSELAARREQRSAVALSTLFAVKPLIVIGRSPECDICLPHPSVSRYHALLERSSNGLLLRDLGSVNGIFVGGQRVLDSSLVREGERVGIGPFLFTLAQGVLTSLDSSRSLRLEARNLERVVPLSGGGTRKLLDNINLVIEPGEFVSLLGPSGSGKSTLMDALNGRRRATGGRVLANGEDFYRHFDSFRQSLGYVPQRDIIHTQLTVSRALSYTARLRLPGDTAHAELRMRVEDVLREMELIPHRDTLVGSLSGGQVKRVSLGAELLARPCLLYIDEATSGLDAGTEARMMRLFRSLADEGKSIVCITHNVDNVDRCHLTIILVRGKLVFFGPPAEAPPYFGVGKISEIYDRLADREPADWEKEFSACSLHREYVEKRQAASPTESGAMAIITPETSAGPSGLFGNVLNQATQAASASGQKAVAEQLRKLTARYLKARELLTPISDAWRQFRVLTQRYVELILGDRRSLGLLFLQAPLVALFLLLGFVNKPYADDILAPRKLSEDERATLKAIAEEAEEHGEVGEKASEDIERILKIKGPVVPYKFIVDPRYTYMLLNILAITVMWFGCNNAAKEIVKEEAVYGRERAVNLGILPYLASKFLVLSIISAVQVLLLMGVVYGGLWVLHVLFGHALPHPNYRLDFPAQFGVLALLSTVGVAAGLLMSACVSSPDRANALLPYVLIPQIILGGGIIPIHTEPMRSLAQTLSPVYWGYRGIHRGATTLPEDLSMHMDYNDSVWIVCLALAIQAVVLLGLTAWCLRRKDVGRG
jgi:ABC-type multidrug transport system ATPase subunit/ABC-type multidrug transport system permease subunit